MNYEALFAERVGRVEFSGIRKFFEMAARMPNPCDLSIGQPDYDAPPAVKQAAVDAILAGHNRYTPTAGLPALRERIAAEVRRETGVDTSVLITSGVSGGLALALLALVNPGDEVVFADPYFISYLQLVRMLGGTPVAVPTYPDFSFDAAKFDAAITPRTKVLIINSPGNPTGRVMTEAEVKSAADLARKHGIVLISDEIYEGLCYDRPTPCPVNLAPEYTLLLRGFGKTHGVTGWRIGYAAGPERLIHEMVKFQQFTYVCAPSPVQHAALVAMDTDVSIHRRAYAEKRDLVCRLLSRAFEFERPGGGFYVFPKAPGRHPSGTKLAMAALEREVLVIPGEVFSGRDSHFRISYATTDAQIRRGCDALCSLAGE